MHDGEMMSLIQTLEDSELDLKSSDQIIIDKDEKKKVKKDDK